jgi:hypothetical protein
MKSEKGQKVKGLEVGRREGQKVRKCLEARKLKAERYNDFGFWPAASLT